MTYTRKVTDDLINAVNGARKMNPEAPGPHLGVAAITAGVPARMVGAILGTYEQTVYRWYKGSRPRDTFLPRMLRLTHILEYGVKAGLLPCHSTLYADIEKKLSEVAAAYKQEAVAGRKS